MRVALIAHNAAAADAIGRQVAARAAFFRERGDEVRVFVESDRRLHPTLRSIARVGEPSPKIVAELRRCDLLILEYGHYYSLLDVLPDVAGRGPRILFDYQGVTPPELWDGPAETPREGRRRRGLVWYADRALVHSEFTRRELCEATGYPSERIDKLPLWFEPPRPGPATLKRTLGLNGERLLLFVGRLAVNKRVPVLIEALAKLKDAAPGYHAAIVGDGEGVYRRERERCRRLAAELGVTERVHFLGRVDDEILADAYRSADVFVMPSLHEGCCLPVLEALAAGVPVVAAHAAALPETLGAAGLTFTPDDAHDLARHVQAACGFAGFQHSTNERYSHALITCIDATLRSNSPIPRESAALEVHGPLSLRITNTGTVPLWPDGPRAAVVRTSLGDSPLLDPVLPGRSATLRIRALPSDECVLIVHEEPLATASMSFDLDVTELQTRLADAADLVELPAGYEDISEGRLAHWKQAIKHKLLHQFQVTYVDVLSRQQTALNKTMLAAMQELASEAQVLRRRVEELSVRPGVRRASPQAIDGHPSGATDS